MKKVKIKGLQQFYFRGDEVIPETITDSGIVWNVDSLPKVMKETIEKSDHVRAIVARTLPHRRTARIYFVLWYDDTLANDVDRSISANDKIELFNNTVILKYQVTCCTGECGDSFHTLVLPRVTSFSSDPAELNWVGVEDNSISIKNCPNCSGSFRQPVIEIIGEARK